MRSKGGIGESDNSELDDVSVSLRAVRSDRLSDPRTVNATRVTLARPLGRQRDFLCGSNVDRLG